MDMSKFGQKKLIETKTTLKFAYFPTWVGHKTIWFQPYIEKQNTYKQEVPIMAVCAGGRHYKTIVFTEITKSLN